MADFSNLQQDKPIKKADLVTLKNEVKKEVKRRLYNTDITSYSNSTYDYNNVNDIEDEKIIIEYYNKILRPMQMIHPQKIGFNDKYSNSTYLQFSSDETIDNLEELSNYLLLCNKDTYINNQPISNSHCMTACTGMCVNSCGDGCTSCTSCTGCSSCSGCGGACSSGCSGGCTGSGGCSGCDGSCSSGCSGGCTSCSGGCTGSGGCSGCDGGCNSSCKGCSGCSSCSGCGGYCGGCAGSCSGTCQGCGGYCGGCTGSCSGTCTGNCSSICNGGSQGSSK